MTDSGRLMSIEYTLKLGDGEEVDGNIGEDPLTYQEGNEQILPALEEALRALNKGESKDVVIEPEEGYGTVDPDKFFEVETDSIPEEAREVGTTLVAEDEEGQEHHLRVHELKEAAIILDGNHPLAGETLHFAIKVLDVQTWETKK